MSGIEILQEATKCDRVFRIEELLFTPEDAKKALNLFDSLKKKSKEWFKEQPPMRMIFLGRANEMTLPKSGKQIKLEKRELRLKQTEH